jgi:hypothetical protein
MVWTNIFSLLLRLALRAIEIHQARSLQLEKVFLPLQTSSPRPSRVATLDEPRVI